MSKSPGQCRGLEDFDFLLSINRLRETACCSSFRGSPHSLNKSALMTMTGSAVVFSAQWSTSVVSVSTSPAL